MDFQWGVVGIKIPRHFQSGKARLSAVLAHVMAIPVDGIGVPLAHVPAQKLQCPTHFDWMLPSHHSWAALKMDGSRSVPSCPKLKFDSQQILFGK